MIGLPTTPIVSLILAQNEDRVIGADDTIPWSNKKDLQFYKHNTLSKVVIIGRVTYDSLPDVALRGRTYIVVTRDESRMKQRKGVGVVYFAKSIDMAFVSAFQMCREDPKLQGIVFAGGADVYTQALNMGLVDEILVTRIYAETPKDAKRLTRSPLNLDEIFDDTEGVRVELVGQEFSCVDDTTDCFLQEGEESDCGADWYLLARIDADTNFETFLNVKFNANLKAAEIAI
jgi:dihydrofolate reductase